MEIFADFLILRCVGLRLRGREGGGVHKKPPSLSSKEMFSNTAIMWNIHTTQVTKVLGPNSTLGAKFESCIATGARLKKPSVVVKLYVRFVTYRLTYKK